MKEDVFKKYKDVGYRHFSILGTNKSGNSERSNLKSNYSKEDIEKWFENPDKYSVELRDLSRYL